jgi:hypothetical protein
MAFAYLAIELLHITLAITALGAKRDVRRVVRTREYEPCGRANSG